MTTPEITDMLYQPLAVGDFVSYFGNIYQVVGLGQPRRHTGGALGVFASCRLMLVNPSKTTRPVNKNTSAVVKVDDRLVEVWVAERERQRLEHEELMRRAGVRS